MRIKKLQEGGAVPFGIYTPTPMSTPIDTTAAQKAAVSSGGVEGPETTKGIAKDILKAVTENGIPSDVEVFLEDLSKFTNGVLDPTASLDSLLSSPQAYSMLISKVNRLRFENQNFKDAATELAKNNAINEVAIGTNGVVYGRDQEGKVKTMTIDDYRANRDKFQLLTNNDLYQMRANDKNLAFNTSLIGTLKNGQGMMNVTNELQNVIDKMKTSKEVKEGFASPSQLEALKGIDEMQGTVKYTTTQESSRLHKERAKNYLFATLSNSAKNLLRVKAAERGMDPDKGAMALIEELIVPSTMESNSITYDLKGGSGSSSGSGSGGDGRKMNLVEMISTNTYSPTGLKPMELNLGSNYSIKAPAMHIKSMVDANTNKPLSINSPLGEIIQNVLPGISDSNSIYFGGQLVSPDKLNRLISADGQMIKVYLPIDQRAKAQGKIKADLGAMKRLEDAQKQITKTMTPAEKLEVYKDHDVLDIMDGSNADNENFAPFMLINAIGQADGLIDKDSSDGTLREVERTDEIERLLEKGYAGEDFGKKGVKDYLNNWFYKALYKGYAFIPLDDNAVAASTMSGNNLTISKDAGNLSNVQRNMNETERMRSYRNARTSSDLLNSK